MSVQKSRPSFPSLPFCELVIVTDIAIYKAAISPLILFVLRSLFSGNTILNGLCLCLCNSKGVSEQSRRKFTNHNTKKRQQNQQQQQEQKQVAKANNEISRFPISISQEWLLRRRRLIRHCLPSLVSFLQLSIRNYHSGMVMHHHQRVDTKDRHHSFLPFSSPTTHRIKHTYSYKHSLHHTSTLLRNG